MPTRPSELAPLLELVANDERLTANLKNRRAATHRVRQWLVASDEMVPVQGPPAHFDVPPIATAGDLAKHLGVSIGQLPWFADLRRMNAARSDLCLRHYQYRWVRKPSGGMRLLETPKPRLKAIQRSLLQDILSRCPTDDAAHGFVPGRSVLSYAKLHVAQQVVLRLDLEDFFLSIRAGRITAIFRRLGYPEPVARMLTGLCCTPTPEDIIAKARPTLDFQTIARMRDAHLAQGAPTSPALSNLACLRLDRRLRGLARAAGARYSRYADDLAFSGGDAFQRGVSHFIVHASAIALEEGFRVRHRKTRVMRDGGRQWLSGVVVNDRLNIRRDEYDRLRATLHNAVRLGPDSQNREGHADFKAHLRGRLAWVAASNRARAEKLERVFEQIRW
ncbi:MAG TPA: reverse transcriptase family protein [Polyangiales bacterium]|nr:reverse transcriptase family protein [Polyangiales bacterium]